MRTRLASIAGVLVLVLWYRCAWTFELPFEARLEAVIERGSIEGQAVRVARFTADLDLARAQALLRSAWSGPMSAPVLAERLPGWLVLSAWSSDGWRTVQLRARSGGGVEGLMSLWAPIEDGVRMDAAPPASTLKLLPHGAQVLRQFSTADVGRRGFTVVASMPGSVAWSTAAISARLADAGFRRDPVLRAVGPQAQAMLFRRGPVEVLVTVSAAATGRSGVVLHRIEETP